MSTYTRNDADAEVKPLDKTVFQLFSPLGKRWIHWQSVPEEKDDGSIKWTKPPFQVEKKNRIGKPLPAKTNAPSHWSTLQTALAKADLRRRVGLCLAGLLDDKRLVAIDLDACRDPETGEIATWARAIVAEAYSFTEVSVSKTGLKIYGWLPKDFQLPMKRKDKVNQPCPPGADAHHQPGWELLIENRYSAVSFDHLSGSPMELRDLSAIVKKLTAGSPSSPQAGRPAPSSADAEYERDAREGGAPPADDRQWSAEDVAAMLAVIPNDDAHYDDWIQIGFALGHWTGNGDVGLKLFQDWSAKSRKCNHAQTERIYRAARHDREKPVTIGTIVHLAKQHGWRAPHSGEDDDRWSDIALARQVAQEWADSARYIDDMKRWFLWSGVHWKHDTRLEHLSRIQDFLVRVSREHVQRVEARGTEDDIKAARAKRHDLRSAKRRAAVYAEVKPSPHLALEAKQLDNDPWLLGTPAGTVDLRSGKLEPARPEDYVTKLTAVAPAPPGTPAPVWNTFLNRIFRHAPELIPYMQRVMGYALTGLVLEQIFLFGWGGGGNGKGTFFHTIGKIMMDYAGSAAHNMLLATPNEKHPTDLADLQGRRLVLASEISPGSRWDEAKLKLITGEDPIKARVMRGNFYQFDPSHLLVVFGQHKPSLSSVDDAMRRRIRLVPFTQKIGDDEKDPHLMQKLEAERPAILRWLIDGCLAWQRDGLQTPKIVTEKSESYLHSEDVLGTWIEECCTVGPGEKCLLAQLYGNWEAWAVRNGHRPGSSRALGAKLEERDYGRGDNKKGVIFFGLSAVKVERKEPQGNVPF